MCYSFSMNQSTGYERRQDLERPQSTLHYVLSGLIPFTEANLNLTFRPHSFFNELERISKQSAAHSSFRAAYYRALKNKLIEIDADGIPRLTPNGQKRLRLYQPKTLDRGAKLLLIFDIPEIHKKKRDRLRSILREYKFEQIQKSVWQTEYDVLGYLKEEIYQSQLEEYVILYESSRVSI